MEWFKGHNAHPPYYVIRTVIMEKMGWDYWTYRRQPLWVVNDVIKTMAAEAQAQKEEQTMHEAQSRGSRPGRSLSGSAALAYIDRNDNR